MQNLERRPGGVYVARLTVPARLRAVVAGQHRRHGYRMLHNRLRHEGWAINVKRT